jgi:hypothetical protein
VYVSRFCRLGGAVLDLRRENSLPEDLRSRANNEGCYHRQEKGQKNTLPRDEEDYVKGYRENDTGPPNVGVVLRRNTQFFATGRTFKGISQINPGIRQPRSTIRTYWGARSSH